MNSIRISFIIFLQISELLLSIKSDHVQLINCPEDPQCRENMDEHLLMTLQDNMFNETDPCEHFWDYACGSWTSAPYYDHVDNFGAMANNYADKLIHILESLYKTKSKDYEQLKILLKQLRKYFLSCKASGSYYLEMSRYLRELPVYKIFGESFKWKHIFEKETENIWQDFQWLKSLAYLRKYGFKDIFIWESVGFAWNNSEKYVVELKIPQAKKRFTNKYKILQIMEEFNLIINHNESHINYLNLAHELYQFDKDLMEVYKKYEDQKIDHYISYQDLKLLVSDIDWDLYFRELLNQKLLPESSIEFSGTFQYFHDLQFLLQKTPARIKASYILLTFCQYLMDIRPLITEQECMLHTNVMFPLGVNFIYNKFLYKNRLQDENLLQSIFDQLKYQFSLYIEENKFSLSIKEQKYLLDKLQLMQLRIGNLPLSLPNLNRYYSVIELIKNSFHHNHLEMLKFRTLLQHQPLFQTSADFQSYYTYDDISQLRNAPYFIHQHNLLVVPMLFLQLPFYHYALNPVFQYSLVGWIMAHEMSHAFDTHGLKYDAWGNENLFCLQISRKQAYISAVDCLTKHAATVSLNEKMADVNGLQLVWDIFSKEIFQDGGFQGEFTIKQLFFINFAQFFCGSLPQPIGHDRDDVRVRQAIINMREFSQVFKCSKEAKENPSEKCSIWRK
ncbi:neprilysin-like 10 [Cochliomyia hominivorax]